MPVTTWKVMVRRADEANHHYVATHQRGRAPTVGEELELVVDKRMVKWTIAEISRDPSTRGVDVFTVRVDEIDRHLEGFDDS
jgi:hypothetical protein